ncbi:hypothetical protein RRG08_053312 [Elysia crispata]|uniref:Uncharacterized protein n=1 Tax=Elysia crispata TaxID=231223 RepID=A0AAE0Z658_9GAST|nr:hypothetical protein RRG08_053312 [Elysia crispata]
MISHHKHRQITTTIVTVGEQIPEHIQQGLPGIQSLTTCFSTAGAYPEEAAREPIPKSLFLYSWSISSGGCQISNH